jgi:hypothetical protein
LDENLAGEALWLTSGDGGDSVCGADMTHLISYRPARRWGRAVPIDFVQGGKDMVKVVLFRLQIGTNPLHVNHTFSFIASDATWHQHRQDKRRFIDVLSRGEYLRRMILVFLPDCAYAV